uniref:RING-type domain-containing protein n=1 Tax=Periophthalmus magnuspinnatus TaxID=409849 RepID=A0A3B3ZJ11_9GOBI
MGFLHRVAGNLFPMASPWTEEETFTCSVCLETLRDPATLPCGHSYCLVCIQDHWDKKDSQGQYSCPQCRQVFNPRPSLAKSTLLVEAMEKLRTNSLRQKEPSNAPPSLPIYMDVLPGDGPQYQRSSGIGPRQGMCRGSMLGFLNGLWVLSIFGVWF